METRMNICLNLETGAFMLWDIYNDALEPPTRYVDIDGKFQGKMCLEFNAQTLLDVKNTVTLELTRNHFIYNIFDQFNTEEELRLAGNF